MTNVAHDPLRAGSTAFRPTGPDAREASNDALASPGTRPPHVTSFTSSYDASGRRAPISLRRRNNLIYGACAIALMIGIGAKAAFDHLAGPNLNTEDVQDVQDAEHSVDPTTSTPLATAAPAATAIPLSTNGPHAAISNNDASNTSGNHNSAALLPNTPAQATANTPVLTDPSQSEAADGNTNDAAPISHRCLAHPHWTGCRAMYVAHQRALDAAAVTDSNETVLDLPDTDTHTLIGNDTWAPTHKHYRSMRHWRHFSGSYAFIDGHH